MTKKKAKVGTLKLNRVELKKLTDEEAGGAQGGWTKQYMSYGCSTDGDGKCAPTDRTMISSCVDPVNPCG